MPCLWSHWWAQHLWDEQRLLPPCFLYERSGEPMQRAAGVFLSWRCKIATEVAKLIVIVNYFSRFIHASRDLFPADFSEWKRGLSLPAFAGAGGVRLYVADGNTMAVVAVCCLIPSGVKPSWEVSHMQIKRGESRDLNSKTDLRRRQRKTPVAEDGP